jgi:hypothetical protein
MTEISQLIAGGAARTSMRAMSGLEFLRALMDGTLLQPAFSSTSRIKPVSAEEGRVVFEGEHRYADRYGHGLRRALLAEAG